MCVLEKASVPLRLQSNEVDDVRWLLALIKRITGYVYGAFSRRYPAA
jgi:hypothetical protein